jgi:hypothetical protein
MSNAIELCTPGNEREQSHHDAVTEVLQATQQLLAGVLMLEEYINFVSSLKARVKPLQPGDIEPITGLRLLTPEEEEERRRAA